MHWKTSTTDETVACSICNLPRKVEGYSGIELSTLHIKRGEDVDSYGPACNVVLKLSCGHLMVDDCDEEHVSSGTCYDSVQRMEKGTFVIPA